MAESSQRFQEAVRGLGLDDTTQELVRILPLVYVAWSDGEMQPDELSAIHESADALGIENAASQALLKQWLDERPSQDFFDKGLKLLSYVLATLPQEEAEQAAADVTSMCEAVAGAAGGMSGHSRKVGPEERVVMRNVSMRLKLGSKPETRKTLQLLLGGGGDA